MSEHGQPGDEARIPCRGPVEIGQAGALAVDVRGLVKSYQGTPAVRGIGLAIRQGEVFALLGPNGAGKTTTVEILEGYRTRDHGEVNVLGVDPGRQRARLKSRMGIVLQSTGIDRYLTVRETIACMPPSTRAPGRWMR
jgi:ABC-2 type transport system ATP-binding protein